MEDPDCYDRRPDSKKQEYGTKLRLRRDSGMYKEAYVLLHRACNLCVVMTIIYMNAVREAT